MFISFGKQYTPDELFHFVYNFVTKLHPRPNIQLIQYKNIYVPFPTIYRYTIPGYNVMCTHPMFDIRHKKKIPNSMKMNTYPVVHKERILHKKHFIQIKVSMNLASGFSFFGVTFSKIWRKNCLLVYSKYIDLFMLLSQLIF